MCADNARASETGGEMHSIMPHLLDVTNDNIKKYIAICDGHRPRRTGFVSYSCLICSSDCLTEVDKHLEIAKHKEVLAALCYHCNTLLVTDKKVGFNPHLESQDHTCVANFQKSENKIDAFGKDEYEAAQNDVNKLNGEDKIIPTKVEKEIMEDFQKLYFDEVAIPDTGKTNTRPQGDRIITFQLRGKFPDFLELYDELKKHGRISFLARHMDGRDACVSFDPLYGPLYLGMGFEVKKVHKPNVMIKEIEREHSWQKWSNRDITPECKSVFCYKRVWENHMENVLGISEKTVALFNKIQGSMYKCLKKTLSRKYPDLVVSFYGPCLTGLMTEEDLVFIFLGIPENELCEITKIFKNPNRISHANGDFKLLSESPLTLSFNDIFRCVVTTSVPSFESSLAIKTLVALSEEARWLILTVKQWWMLNDPQPSSSAWSSVDGLLEWLVLFFLMTSELIVIPNTDFLMNIGAAEEDLVEGQVTPFTTDTNLVEMYLEEANRSSNTKQPYSFNLVSFFLFFQNLNFHDCVLCPSTGALYPRNTFLEHVSPSQRALLQRDTFIMPHPFDQKINMFSGLSKKDYYLFKNKVLATIQFMIS